MLSIYFFEYGQNRPIHAVHGVNGTSANVLFADSCFLRRALRSPKSNHKATLSDPLFPLSLTTFYGLRSVLYTFSFFYFIDLIRFVDWINFYIFYIANMKKCCNKFIRIETRIFELCCIIHYIFGILLFFIMAVWLLFYLLSLLALLNPFDIITSEYITCDNNQKDAMILVRTLSPCLWFRRIT